MAFHAPSLFFSSYKTCPATVLPWIFPGQQQLALQSLLNFEARRVSREAEGQKSLRYNKGAVLYGDWHLSTLLIFSEYLGKKPWDQSHFQV